MTSINKNEGKPRPSLLVRDMGSYYKELIRVREMGSVKYSRLNWVESRGTEDEQRFLDENLDSILRHVMAMIDGETHDEESGLTHAAHIGIRAGFAHEYLRGQI